MMRFLSMKRLSLLFLALFGVLAGGAVAFDRFWVEPGERCVREGNWYDIETRICARPIYIPDITGRPAGVTRAEASAEKNRELVALEAEVTRRRAARDAEVERGRAALAAAQGN